MLAINTDITEKKKLEAQFMRAQRMESVGTLAGGIAHDLNNILAPIILSIDFLKTITDHPQAKKILDTIDVSAKRGSDIVRQVLSFARGLEGQRIEVQPRHLLKDLETIIKRYFSERHSFAVLGSQRHMDDFGRSNANSPNPLESLRQCQGCDAERRQLNRWS